MQLLGAGFRRVLDGATARVAVLRRVGGRDHLHLADALDGRSAFMALVVAGSVAEGDAVEEVLHGGFLAAVQPRLKLAAAKHRIAIGLHRVVAGLQLQQRFGQADVGTHDDRQIAVVVRVDRMGHISVGRVEDFRRSHDGDLVRQRPELHHDVLPEDLAANQTNAGADGGLESRDFYRNGVRAEDQ